MLQGEHSAILSTFIKLPFVIKNFVLSIFEWLFYTSFTVYAFIQQDNDLNKDLTLSAHLLLNLFNELGKGNKM